MQDGLGILHRCRLRFWELMFGTFLGSSSGMAHWHYRHWFWLNCRLFTLLTLRFLLVSEFINGRRYRTPINSNIKLILLCLGLA